jgi:flavin-dependent dehydrogenase
VNITADALIIGAGPAGSATGALLADAGLRVVVVDRASFPRDKPCAEYLSPAAVSILERLGAMSTLEDAGASPLAGTTVMGAYGARLTGLFAKTGLARQPFSGLAVTRRILDAALVDIARSRGATVMEQTRVVELVRRRGVVTGAVIATAGGKQATVTAPVTVGADGLHSAVARWFGPVKREPLRRWAFVGHFAGVTGLADRAELHVGTEGYAGLNPIGPNIANVALVVPRHVALRARGDVADFFHHTLERFDGIKNRVPVAGSLDPIRAVGPFGVRARRPVVDGGLLVGDAAEFFDPFTGEGVHSALRGAELASEAILGAGRGPIPLSATSLNSYVRARRRAFWGKWVVERMIGYGMLMPRLFDRTVDRIGRKEPMAHTLIGVTGNVVSPGAVLNPVYLTRMVL